MFWGLVLEPSKKYTQKVDQTFHISQAALDLKDSDNAGPIQLVVEYENSSFILATLSKKANIYQVPLDLIFKTGDQVSFRTIGNGKVHLSGYHVLEDLDNMIMNGEEESDLDDMEEEIEKVKGKRKKLTPNSKGGKKLKLDNSNEVGSDEDDDADEDSEDEEDEKPSEKKAKKKKQKSDSSFGSIIGDEDEDDFDEEEDDEDEDDLDTGEEEDDDEELDFEDFEDDDVDDEDDEDEEDEEPETPKTPKSASKKSPQTPNGVASAGKGKDKSSQKMNKSAQQGTPSKDGKTPKSETKQKGEKNAKSKNAESTPQKKNEEKTQKSAKSEDSPQKKVLEGGVISEEIKVGNGPVAKPGKMVNVYYTGILGSTKKQFDSVQSGSGFKFRVGRNEVIKGWDIGIIGMKVGGKRRLTIPPHLAYGSKGSPPVIPPNSTLVFTVELRGLS